MRAPFKNEIPSEPWHQGAKNSLSEAPARRRKRVLVINGAHSGRGARFRLPATSDLRGLMSTGRVIHSAVICWTHPSSLALFLFSAGPLRADQENLAPSRAHTFLDMWTAARTRLISRAAFIFLCAVYQWNNTLLDHIIIAVRCI